MFGSVGDLDPIRTLAAIRCPTLVVHSELDPIPVEWAHVLLDAIPGADFVLLEGAGHFPHVEDPDLLADAVLPWLTKHAA
jgi:pimeloyl-ACP methyl ester carboxylesterase